MEKLSLTGCPTPARRFAVRAVLVLAAGSAVVPVGATAAAAMPAEAHQLPPSTDPLPTQAELTPPTTKLDTPPKPAPTLVQVTPGSGGVVTQPPVIVVCKPADTPSCTPPSDPAGPDDVAAPTDAPGDPVGPTDVAAPTAGPTDPGAEDPADDGAGTGTGAGAGSGSSGTGSGAGGAGRPRTGGGTTGERAPTAGTPSSTPSADPSPTPTPTRIVVAAPEGCDPKLFDGLAPHQVTAYLEHGQCPADPAEPTPYALIAGLGLLGAALVGLVTMAITGRPRLRVGT